LPGRDSQEAGNWAEAEAERYLRHRGLQLVQRNFRCRRGEIDLIMTDADVLVFIEVRYRRASRFGTGAESVTTAKQRRLLATARLFLARAAPGKQPACRFDVMSVGRGNYGPEFRWIRDAFTQVV
jgi:putative endonuclease